MVIAVPMPMAMMADLARELFHASLGLFLGLADTSVALQVSLFGRFNVNFLSVLSHLSKFFFLRQAVAIYGDQARLGHCAIGILNFTRKTAFIQSACRMYQSGVQPLHEECIRVVRSVLLNVSNVGCGERCAHCLVCAISSVHGACIIQCVCGFGYKMWLG